MIIPAMAIVHLPFVDTLLLITGPPPLLILNQHPENPDT